MKYDLRHATDVRPFGCGKTFVSPDLGDDHDAGDRIEIRCPRCGTYGPHEVRGRLEGLA